MTTTLSRKMNGPSREGCDNPQHQGLYAALTDGHWPNNVFGRIPSIALDYTPVWDANALEWAGNILWRTP